MFERKPAGTIDIWTDGSCSPNPGPGGWGALLIAGKQRAEISGGEKAATNNRMELLAPIHVLETLQERYGRCSVRIRTDSTYVKNGATRWIQNWKASNWRTASGKPVLNRELWQRLDEACTAHNVEWQWVRGHTGDPGNERADKLARQAMPRTQ